MTTDEIKALLLQDVKKTVRHLLPNGEEYKGDWLVGSTSGETGGSMRVRLEGDNKGLWLDFASTDKGNIIQLWQAVKGIDHKAAMVEMHDWLGIPQEEDKATKSATWKRVQSEMGSGTIHDITQLANLRKLPTTAGLELAIERHHLFFGPVADGPQGGPYTNHHCWIVTDNARKSAQARRLDGQAFFGDQKTKTISGTTGKWPIGMADSTLPEVALTEGGPDLLAAYTAVALLGCQDRIQPACILGSGQVIHSEAVPLFAHKLVWLFPHSDSNYAGLQGAIRWEMQLKKVNARIVPFDFSPYPGVKDLNDFIAVIPAADLEGVPA
jgi:hypothetical protein